MKKSELKQIIRGELLKESFTVNTWQAISGDLSDFLTKVVIPKAKSHGKINLKNERDAALLLYDILKLKYKIG